MHYKPVLVKVFTASEKEFQQLAANSELVAEIINQLPDSDTVLLKSNASPFSKLQSLLGKYLLRRMLLEYSGSPHYLTAPIVKEENGKPYIDRSPISFNLSHTETGIALIISSSGPCGIDIQSHREDLDVREISLRCCSTSESAKLNSIPYKEQHELFLSLFCLKEAYSKLTGKGLSQSFKTIDFHSYIHEVHKNKSCSFSFENSWTMHYQRYEHHLSFIYKIGLDISIQKESCSEAIQFYLSKP
ncbi:4'-phosphopantetheinyl transferase [Vibrio crassostreae]|nr:4'-phosphopantetheinyl transferase [Vibrio crassostreae]CAK2804066.1 4'-phosphopantetheinyl transferase [Vibrio crassostreae]CAK3292205.1 4'-phosphopantetheinyl transferase [Vibrio crassostreae]CAK3846889.1 4'-phosphopantetheinyl transferase [Vibrio crassostreae]